MRPPRADQQSDDGREGVPEMVPAGEETRIRSLAAMARALGRSEALFRLLEIAAEEAKVAMGAASVSVGRRVPGPVTLRTIVRGAGLGRNEVRWPGDEVCTIDEFDG